MAQTQRDVKIVYDDPPDQVVTTPQGTSLSGTIGSGFPTFQGVVPPVFDRSWDLDLGPFVLPMDLNIGGNNGAGQTLPTIHQNYLTTGGVNGTGAVRRNWFPGMNPGSSPLWVEEFAMPTSRHFLIKYMVKQSDQMDSDGSTVKLLRIYNGVATLRKLGSFLMGGGPTGHANYHTWEWSWEGWRPTKAARKSGVIMIFDNTYHEYSLEVDMSDINALFFEFKFDGNVIFQSGPTPSDVGDYIIPGAALFFSPFVEQYSGVGPSVNTGTYDVDNVTYTVL